MTVSENIIEKAQTPTLTNNKTHWEYFRFYVNEKTDLNVSLKTPYEGEVFFDILINIIQSGLEKYTN